MNFEPRMKAIGQFHGLREKEGRVFAKLSVCKSKDSQVEYIVIVDQDLIDQYKQCFSICGNPADYSLERLFSYLQQGVYEFQISSPGAIPRMKEGRMDVVNTGVLTMAEYKTGSLVSKH